MSSSPDLGLGRHVDPLPATADVVIIGGGAIGCSSGYHLAAGGVSGVVLLEQRQFGSGSSSKSAAMLTLQFCRDPLTVRMAKYSYERFMRFADEFGAPIDFHRSGWMYVATATSEAALRKQAALLQALDVATEILTAEEVKRRYPELNTDDIVLGSWGPDDGPFDPHMIMAGYLRRARQMGVRAFEGVRVREIILEKGRVTGVFTDQGVIATETVINAAGPWADRLGAKIGVSIPLCNATRSIVVTHPIAAIPKDRPFVEDLTFDWYFRPEQDGVLMGMGRTPVDDPEPRLDEAQVEALVETAIHRVPVLAQAAPLTAWTGVRPLTPDGHAIVGYAPEVEGFLLNCGWGGVGIMMAPIAGQLAAEYVIQGKATTVDGQALHPDRFASTSSAGQSG